MEKNICKMFHFLVQSPFTASKKKIYYYHQIVNIGIS